MTIYPAVQTKLPISEMAEEFFVEAVTKELKQLGQRVLASAKCSIKTEQYMRLVGQGTNSILERLIGIPLVGSDEVKETNAFLITT